jgi:putative ABC transport system permease protein
MPEWQRFVRDRLRVDRLQPERQTRVVREIAAQLDDLYRDAIQRGLSEAEAEALAADHVGDWQVLSDELSRIDRRRYAQSPLDRAADAIDRRFPRRGAAIMLSHLLRDARYAVRQFAAAPGFTAVAILTMALGIGATTAIFSVVNGVLLRPLPYADPAALVRVHELVPQYGRFSVAPANFLDWRRQTTAFDRIAAYTGASATYAAGDGPERLTGSTVSWDLFPLLGASPALGRGFREDEDLPGKNAVVVLSHATWQRRFGGDPSIVGRTITFSGVPVTVIGVMPRQFYFPNRDTEYWQPIALNPANATRGGHFLSVVARLKRGVTVQSAAAEMRTLAERLAREYPASNADESALVIALHENIVGGVRPALLALFASVVVVVLIACANVANLLLVRASARGREIAIRRAIGAAGTRILQQMLVESLVLALSGGLIGIGLAFVALPAITTLSAGSIPRAGDIAVDRVVLAFAVLVSLATGLLFGLAPAWQASRAAVTDALKEGGRSSTASGRWVRSALLVGEVALSIVLLVAAGLLLRSFVRVSRVDPGFRADGVLVFRAALPQTVYADDAKRVAFYDRLLDGLRHIPGVTASALVQTMPMRGDYVLSFAVEGRPAPEAGKSPSANYRTVTPEYFQALGVPLLRGRVFNDHDTAAAPLVAIVDDAFVRKHFPNEDPIGRGIDIGNGTDGFCQIVGVVGNVHYAGLDANADPTMYVPLRQDVFSSMWVLTRSGLDPAALAPAARLVLRGIDPSMPATSMSALSDVVSDSVAQRRFSMLLVATFAVTALFLAVVGVYGVVTYSVSLRTPEIGLRLAMGAQRAQVMRMILGGGMRLVAIGLAAGLGGAVVLSRVIQSQLLPLLFETTPFDAVSYAVTAATLLAVAMLACVVPARRAMRVDPIVALRQS